MSRKSKITFGAIALVILLCPQLSGNNAEILPSDEYFNKVHSLINGASKSISVAMFSFRHYDDYPNSPSNVLIKDLIRANKRGVDVKVLLDISDFDEEITKENRKTGKILSKNGVKVYYDSMEVTNHAKAIVIDSKYTIIGSHNWTYYGLSKNNEISILIDSEELAKKVEKYIMELINNN